MTERLSNLNPSLSVIIPTYQRSDYLKEAIENVLIQDYPNLEIIIVDDNANDLKYREQTKELLKSYEDLEIRVKGVFPDKNLGGALARNYGVEASEADIIAFLDDDDYFYPGKISACVKALEERAVDFVYNFVIDSNGRIYEDTFESPIADLFRTGSLFATSQLVVKRDCLLSIGGFDQSPAKQDAILTFKLLEAGYKMGVVPQVLNYYRHHDQGRISTRLKSYEGEENLKKRYDSIKSQFSVKERRDIEVSMYTRILKRAIQMRSINGILKYILLGTIRHHIFFVRNVLREMRVYQNQKK